MGDIYNIPAGIPFAKSLAAKLLEEDPETLPDTLILLPTRRACRTLREAFLQQNNGKPILLPRMQPIGDIDEEELSLSIAGQGGTQTLLDLPPALPTIRRQILLARAIHAAPDFPHAMDHAFALAKALGQLMDQIYTENLNLADLQTLVPEDFATHWQVTLDFLKILSETWPNILKDLGMIDAADRRNRLILALASFWQDHPPQTSIIAAGTTGSIPATAALLKAISTLPNGQIILPGLDEDIDDESWNALSESHPQYGLKSLLEALETDRQTVKLWHTEDTALAENRRFLASELMRPAETTRAWQTLKTNTEAQQKISSATRNLSILTCETAQEEANIIALLMRQTLEQPTSTAALITPDRKLATRVSAAAKRWNITLDDSAGTPLSQTLNGQFLTLLSATCETNLAPVSLLALLKHPFIPFSPNTITLEEHLLRGIKPKPGFEGLNKRLEDTKHENLKPYIAALEETLSPLLTLYQSNEKQDFKTLLTTHINTAETLTQTDIIWNGEPGNTLSSMLAKLMDHATDMPKMRGLEYTQILQQFLSTETLRPAYGTHPRLQILGQLEARMIDADLVILASLNEDTWPPKNAHDPWMSRPMRSEYGLPGSERSIGLAAHDFVQGFCTPNIVITRSKISDGAPTIPARWLQRLNTVLTAAQINPNTIQTHPAQHWAKQLDQSDTITPIKRPAPKPPAELRPKRFRITEIETWLKDPYSIYARHILRLEPLKPLEQDADAALRGQIIHDTLDDFITTYPETLPKNAATILTDIAQHKITENDFDHSEWQSFHPRFTAIADAFITKETIWRETAKPLKSEISTEIRGELHIADAIIYGRADRIDKIGDSYAIIDYKSGGQFAKRAIANGDTPQLAIEGLIAQEGGFETLSPAPCNYLGYWVLNPNSKDTEINETEELLQETHESLETLITTFEDENTPYHALPRSNTAPRFHDYAHLARVQEWAALDETEDAA